MNTKKLSLFALASLVLVLFLGLASGAHSETTRVLSNARFSEELSAIEELEVSGESLTGFPKSRDTPLTVASVAPPSNPWANYPNVCETFKIIQSSKRVKDKKGKWRYPVRYKRNRYKRPYQDRRRTRKLVEFVAKEMGVSHPKFFSAMAMHESTWNPEAIHILNPDLKANQRAWERHSYSRAKEVELEEKLSNANARRHGFWRLKAQLADLQLYKGNTHWNDRLTYNYVIPKHTILLDGVETMVPQQSMKQTQNVWSFGYGLYGMYSVGYVKIWDREAPPWILCAEEGIVATIIEVWAARSNTTECDVLTRKNPEKWGSDGGTYQGVLRRLARGHCGDQRLGPVWQHLMKQNDSVPWDEHATFGKKWPRYEMKKRRGRWVYQKDPKGKRIPTDREVLLEYLVTKARDQGLLREVPLERHNPETKPVVVASRSGNRLLDSAP